MFFIRNIDSKYTMYYIYVSILVRNRISNKLDIDFLRDFYNVLYAIQIILKY